MSKLTLMESHTRRPSKGLIQLLAIVALVLTGFWMYAPALDLPPSLIDDYGQLENMDRWTNDYQQGGLKYAIQNDIGIAQEVYNTGFWFLGNLCYRMTDGKPFHWLVLTNLVFVCGLLFTSIRRLGERKEGTFLAAFVMVLLFLTAEVPGTADFQGLRTNWYRLFATDQFALVFLAVFVFVIIQIVRTVNASIKLGLIPICLYIIATVTGIITFTIKLPFAVLSVAPLLVLAAVSWKIKNPKLAYITVSLSSLIGIAFLSWYLILSNLNVESNDSSYGNNFSVRPSDLITGLKVYLYNYWRLFGPLFPAICLALPWTMLQTWRAPGPRKHLFLSLVFLVFFTGLACLVYIPWNSRLPRYMLVGVFGFSILAGVVATVSIQSITSLWHNQKLWLLFLPIGVLATLLPSKVLVLIAIVAGIAMLFRWERVGVPFLSGIGIVGIAYIIAVAPAVRVATNNVYIHREKANWEMTKALLEYSAQNQNVCYVGSLGDEHLGSMAGFVKRMGGEPRLYSSDDSAHCGPDALLLIHNWLSPSDAENQAGERPVIKDIGALSGDVPVPVSFWEFRKRLGNGRISENMVNYWSNDYTWRLYGKADK